MKICSDVDGVILDYIQGFIDFTEKEDIPFNHNPKLYGVIRNMPNKKKIYKKFHSGDYLRKLNFYDYSLQILNFLANQHELYLVSALEPEQFHKREENLNELNYFSLKCVGEFRKKETVIEDVKPDVMIEDHPELIKSFHNAGIRVIFPNWHLYTKGMENFATPFSSWREIPKLLRNPSKLN